jgi:hypothetical protein
MSARMKKGIIAALVLVPGLAFAGIKAAEMCGWCPFCN